MNTFWIILITLWLLSHAVGILLTGHLLLSRRRTISLIIWTLWLVLFPAVGIPFYFLLGTDRIRKKRLEKYREERDDCTGNRCELPELDQDIHPLLNISSRINQNYLCTMQPPEVLPDTENYYPHLLEKIRQAQHHVHYQTYVWRDDSAGHKMLNALVDAASRGVKVRLLVDELGVEGLPESFFDPLVKAGGEFSWCLTIHPRRNRFFFNLRNHRKLQIIDGNYAYVGGMNVGCEYEGKNPDVGPWRDMQIGFQGKIIQHLQNLFMEDWHFATEQTFSGDEYFNHYGQPGEVPVCTVESGPDILDQPFLKSFLLMAQTAEKRLDLFTPYFAPNSEMWMGIQLAAQRGIRVRLMISTLNEHQFMVDIGRSFYEPLLEAGVEIYELPDEVHHAKIALADDDLVMIGSTNLDVRSIRLNFELSLLLQHQPTVQQLDEHYTPFFERSELVDLTEFRNRPLRRKLKEGFVKLFTPLL